MAAIANTTTRTALKGAGVCAVSSFGSVSEAITNAHPDAILIALGNRYEAAFAYWRETYSAWIAAEEAYNSVTPFRATKQIDDYFKGWKECGGEAVCKACEDAWDAVQWLQNEVLQTPSRSLAGLAIKSRVIRLILEGSEIAADTTCPEMAEWHAGLLRDFTAEARRLGQAGFSQEP
ncbi:hypothetical protein HR059_17475 [Sinorhizobium meliloti WSM1022]|jgi:hypothetical protein|uniref:hypothetical protein n=1 Tax=Rhizobium meliloti TaxID=382 RepID=UPI000428E412|nr:hypothetical protein [Sinorhizobium meliloti]ASQ05405.1 hypothetical protein CDO23_16570 [Sinorhizobium meliloti]MDW9829358.1 hypothetical protein [Sinorhizobium meliloti]MDW9840936.1 hypothetical protein [Sinorhizobium meliloti]MDX0009409.1 hypothetical protein [Sinorhizobium meliloti]MDX0064182.1 hypothetical protein [Sinorhizobium meliloti]